ncbi:rhamnosyltransferase [Sphingomonas sp. Leaf17]|nr:rhamnosyltransferase [Sphingomonas sp. Leaf17]
MLARTVVVIPTLNAGSYLSRLIDGLQAQAIRPDQVLVIDSESTDDTCERFAAFGAKVVSYPRRNFNHGGTRAHAISLIPDAEYIVMMTQDAIPADGGTIRNLVRCFADPDVGMAYGRQLPRPGSRAIERFSRLFNYPAVSEVRSLADRARLGVKTTFCSNSFAAYRRVAYDDVGGFEHDAFFAEDQVVAGRMLLAGRKLAYAADACVHHSHDYTIKEEFRRYFDVGVFHLRNPWLRENFGAAEGEGIRYLRNEFAHLRQCEPASIPTSLVRTIAKYAGYRLGRVEASLPTRVKARLSMQPRYWRKPT